MIGKRKVMQQRTVDAIVAAATSQNTVACPVFNRGCIDEVHLFHGGELVASLLSPGEGHIGVWHPGGRVALASSPAKGVDGALRNPTRTHGKLRVSRTTTERTGPQPSAPLMGDTPRASRACSPRNFEIDRALVIVPLRSWSSIVAARDEPAKEDTMFRALTADELLEIGGGQGGSQAIMQWCGCCCW